MDRILLPRLPGMVPKRINRIFKLKSDVECVTKEIIKEYNPDIIHAHLAQAGFLLSDLTFPAMLLDMTDCSSLNLMRSIRLDENILRKFLYTYHLGRMYNIEKYLLKKFKVTTVISPVDKNHLKERMPSSDIRVIANGVDNKFFEEIDYIEEEYPSIIFFGNMGYRPNVDAVLYLIKELFPQIRKTLPNTKLYLIGANPHKEILRNARTKQIVLTGFVQDIRPYVARASVVIIPLRIGSGIKNKVLEAMAMGKPVVTTPIGAEGLRLEVKRYLLVGKNSKDFVALVIKLLKNLALREWLGECGKEAVRKWYNWDNVANEFEIVYKEMLKGN